MFRWAANPLNVGQWYHLAATFKIDQAANQTIVALYVDGVGVTTTYPASPAIVPSYDWLIGQEQIAASHWVGAIDDAAIWNKALTAEEIQMLASGERTPPEILGPVIADATLLILR